MEDWDFRLKENVKQCIKTFSFIKKSIQQRHYGFNFNCELKSTKRFLGFRFGFG